MAAASHAPSSVDHSVRTALKCLTILLDPGPSNNSVMHRFASRTDWPQTPNPLAMALKEHRQEGRPILDLTESNPTRCGFSYNSDEILSALADPRSLTYSPD